MRSTLLVSAFAALALGAPRPQDIDFDVVDAAPDPEIYTPSVDSLAESVPSQSDASAVSIAKASVDDVATPEKRDLFALIDTLSKRTEGDCSALPAGTGTTVNSPDTPEAFTAYQPFHDDANLAATPVKIPQGYTVSFHDLYASSQTTSWLGTDLLTKYDVMQCASLCDQKQGCQAFNIYYERDPSLRSGDNCPNPPSNTNIKCVKYGIPIDDSTATNFGQGRDQFQVVISGSNGYNRNAFPPSQPGFSGPVQLGGAINAPNDPQTKTNTYMTQKFFSFSQVQTYELGVKACVSACSTQTAYNAKYPPKAPANPAVCNFVVAYVLSDENQPQGVQCALYTEEWASDYATNFGQYRGDHYWSVSQAYAYTNATYDAVYEPICDKGGCPSGSYGGGNCGGYGPGTC